MTNAFSKNYIPTIKLKATPKETQLHAASKAEREHMTLKDASNQISIPSQEASDRSRRVAGRRIGV
jgi:hypothetical protein